MEEVTKKNLKKVEAGKKGYQARLLKLKKEVLAGTTAGTTGTNTATNPGSNSGTTATTPGSSTKCITTDVYI